MRYVTIPIPSTLFLIQCDVKVFVEVVSLCCSCNRVELVLTCISPSLYLRNYFSYPRSLLPWVQHYRFPPFILLIHSHSTSQQPYLAYPPTSLMFIVFLPNLSFILYPSEAEVSVLPIQSSPSINVLFLYTPISHTPRFTLVLVLQCVPLRYGSFPFHILKFSAGVYGRVHGAGSLRPFTDSRYLSRTTLSQKHSLLPSHSTLGWPPPNVRPLRIHPLARR